MTSDRPYRRALSHDEAVAEVERCAGTQFDPELVEVFVELFGEPQELPAAASA
jgi:HD-GYP domain-containing protein (c-di-GMP phosphodiesterase class II)